MFIINNRAKFKERIAKKFKTTLNQIKKIDEILK